MTDTTTTPINIFAQAKKAEPKTAKKTDKQVKEIPLLENKVQRFNFLKAELDSIEAEKKMIEGDIKEIARSEWCKEYEKEKMRPESFVIQDKTGAKVLFMATDKYTLVTPEKEEVINSICPDFLEKNTSYSFDTSVLERNIEAISNAIMGSNMSDEDKRNLIIATETKSIKKGAIERLAQCGQIEATFALINPICMLKPQK